jgi:hypothetical protein
MAQDHEKKINDILLNLQQNERLFKSRAGVAWQGQFVRKGNMLIIKNAVPFYGMPDGFPDLCGWTSVEITPDMVGQTIAVFTAVEVKTGKQKIKKGSLQRKFRDIIIRMGGIHRVQ